MNLVTKDGSDPHALVWAQVVKDITYEDIGNLGNGATRLGVVISAA